MTVGLLHGSKTNARENFLFNGLFKTPNSIWIKSYAVSTDGPCLTDCLTKLSRTVRK